MLRRVMSPCIGAHAELIWAEREFYLVDAPMSFRVQREHVRFIDCLHDLGA